MTITVINTGITLLQDAGRVGFSEHGVPKSGAYDSYRYQLACQLVNSLNAPAFEIYSGAFEIATSQDVVLAVVGPAKVFVDGRNTPTGNTFLLLSNQKLRIEASSNSPSYFVIAGLQVPSVLGSASNDSLSGLGPERIHLGSVFEVIDSDESKAVIGSFIDTKAEPSNHTLRYIPGPHQIELSNTWKVLSTTRIGIRLESETPAEAGSANLASFPVMPGCIQIPPSGQPIILGPDCGTTGGYPVAGVVISADLHLLARLSAGNEVELKAVTIEEAETAKLKLKQQLAKAVIRPNGFGSW